MRRTRPFRFQAVLVCCALAALGGAAIPLVHATPASAVVATGHGVGYESRYGAWIGSYRLADGRAGFCVNLGRTAPTGADFTPVDAGSLGWYGADDLARLAYIGRTWGDTADADTAAAAQFLTWSITGLDGRTPEELLARAGDAAPRVAALVERMRAETESRASRGVAAAIAVATDGETTTVRADLDVDRIAGAERLGADAAQGVIHLTGAVFPNGKTSAPVTNATAYSVVPLGGSAVVQVTATAEFAGLPYGSAAVLGHNPSNVQNLLIAGPAAASASTTTSVQAPNGAPFRPRVSTTTSAATVAVGAAVHDALRVEAAPAPEREDPQSPPVSAEWGVVSVGDGYRPIAVVVRSRLLGPFPEAPAEAAEPPADAPVACEVTTAVDHGTGDYTTPECVLPASGHYVWVDSIDPADTPEHEGRSLVLPWRSGFGVPAETTLAVVAAEAPPVAPAAAPAPEQRLLAETGETGASAATPLTAAAALGAIVTGLLALRRRRARSHQP